MSLVEQTNRWLAQFGMDRNAFEQVLALSRGEPIAPNPLPVPESVWRVAGRVPDAPAVIFRGCSVNYAQLTTWAARIAVRLDGLGVGTGARVAVLSEQSTAMVAAALGVLRGGAAYVPIDVAQPAERIGAILSDADVTAAVVAGPGGMRLASISGTAHIPAVDADDLRVGHDDIEPETVGVRSVAGTDPAYVVYTSGSTGGPKGVLVEHAQLATSTLARQLVYPGAATFLLMSPFCFDSSMAGLWGTLTTGGRLVVPTGAEMVDPHRLLDLVVEHSVTRTLCVPSLYRLLLDAAQHRGMSSLDSLETVIVAGETLPPELVKRHFALQSPSVTLVNEYGPSETTVWASYHQFETAGPVSIGRPVPGARLYVLDPQRRPTPLGVEGELYVGGAGVSRGYLGRPDDTANAFVPDPFAAAPGARMYRTGDRARWNARGTLDFLGRNDHQIKIRGQRIELGEVEAALRMVPGVGDAIAIAAVNRTRVVAFVVSDAAHAAAGLDVDALRAHVAQRLPSVMVPAQIHVLERFPATASGKADRAHLQRVADTALAPAVPSPAPVMLAGNPTAQVSDAWAEILALPDVPPHDANFFDLGGHSLAVFRLQDAIRSRTGIQLSMVLLFQHTTVSAQAALIVNGGISPDESATSEAGVGTVGRARAIRARRQRLAHNAEPVASLSDLWLSCPVPVARPRHRLVCFAHAGGSAALFARWGEHLVDVEVLSVRYPGRAERLGEPAPTDLRQLARQIADAVQPRASVPIALLGHSMGAVVALETALALEQRGVVLAHLFASGSRNADWVAPDDQPDDDDDDAVAAQLIQLGGTEREVADDPYFRELVLPYVRSDTQMFHAYRPKPTGRIRCPVTTIVGDRDVDADRRRWSELTAGPLREHIATGDHFYLVANPPYPLIAAGLEAEGIKDSNSYD